MNKKIDISKTLAKGSAKQRALLYFNNIGEKNRVTIGPDGLPDRNKKGFLTESEERQVFESFKTEAEIRLYNSFLALNKSLYLKEMALTGMMFQYRETIASLVGYCLLYHGYGKFADTLSGLYFAMETPETKKKVIDYLESNKRYLWAEIGPAKDPDSNGIKVYPGWEKPKKSRKNPEAEVPTLRDLLNALSKRAEKQLRECKTVLKALRDRIEETGFKTGEHTDELDKIERDLREDKAPLPKFSRKKTEDGLLEHADDPKQKKRMEEIFGPNWLFPEYEKVEIFEDLYNFACADLKEGWKI